MKILRQFNFIPPVVFGLTLFAAICLFSTQVKAESSGEWLRRHAKVYDFGYNSGVKAGLTWRGEGLAFDQERIEFLKTFFRRGEGKDFESAIWSAWCKGYDHGWKDGYYMTTTSYSNPYK